jgi:hypothetical protein
LSSPVGYSGNRLLPETLDGSILPAGSKKIALADMCRTILLPFAARPGTLV